MHSRLDVITASLCSISVGAAMQMLPMAYSGGRLCDRHPLLLWSDRKFLDKVCTVFVSFVWQFNRALRPCLKAF